MKKPIPIIREQEGNEKNPFPNFGNGKGMKKYILIIQKRESEALILGNGREREFLLTPDQHNLPFLRFYQYQPTSTNPTSHILLIQRNTIEDTAGTTTKTLTICLELEH